MTEVATSKLKKVISVLGPHLNLHMLGRQFHSQLYVQLHCQPPSTVCMPHTRLGPHPQWHRHAGSQVASQWHFGSSWILHTNFTSYLTQLLVEPISLLQPHSSENRALVLSTKSGQPESREWKQRYFREFGIIGSY